MARLPSRSLAPKTTPFHWTGICLQADAAEDEAGTALLARGGPSGYSDTGKEDNGAAALSEIEGDAKGEQ